MSDNVSRSLPPDSTEGYVVRFSSRQLAILTGILTVVGLLVNGAIYLLGNAMRAGAERERTAQMERAVVAMEEALRPLDLTADSARALRELPAEVSNLAAQTAENRDAIRGLTKSVDALTVLVNQWNPPLYKVPEETIREHPRTKLRP